MSRCCSATSNVMKSFSWRTNGNTKIHGTWTSDVLQRTMEVSSHDQGRMFAQHDDDVVGLFAAGGAMRVERSLTNQTPGEALAEIRRLLQT